MSITVPAVFISPGIIDVTTGETIDNTDYSDIFESLHWLWQRAGMRAHGKIFDPVLTTTSATYIGTGIAQHHPQNVLARAAYNAPTRVFLRGLTIVGENIRVQYGTLIATKVGAGFAQVTALELSTGVGYQRGFAELSRRVDVAGTGKLAQIKIHESVDVTSYLS